MARLWEVLRYILTLEFLGGVGETAAMALSYFIVFSSSTSSSESEIVTDACSTGNLEVLISLGMFIIIWYGVMKILLNMVWHFIFGRRFQWEIGLLEILHNRLKPVHAQRIVDSDDKEFDKKVERKIRKLNRLSQSFRKKSDNRRCPKLGKFKGALDKFNANKYTILGSVAAATSAAVGVYSASGGSTEAIQSMEVIEALTAGGFIGAGVLSLKAVFGKGIEDSELYAARKKEESENKQEVKAMKASGKIDIEVEAEKLAKKLGISKEKAIELAKDKEKERQKVADQKLKEKKEEESKKLAKSQGISIEKAREVIESKYQA